MKDNIVAIIIVILIIVVIIVTCGIVFFMTKDNQNLSETSTNDFENETINTDNDNKKIENSNSNDLNEDDTFESSSSENNKSLDESLHDVEVAAFNNTFTMFKGHQLGIYIKDELLEIVIERNEEGTRKVSVIMDNEEIEDTDEINELKTKIQEKEYYDISFDYDGEYINKVIIE